MTVADLQAGDVIESKHPDVVVRELKPMGNFSYVRLRSCLTGNVFEYAENDVHHLLSHYPVSRNGKRVHTPEVPW